jgi:hypothetical protein
LLTLHTKITFATLTYLLESLWSHKIAVSYTCVTIMLELFKVCI